MLLRRRLVQWPVESVIGRDGEIERMRPTCCLRLCRQLASVRDDVLSINYLFMIAIRLEHVVLLECWLKLICAMLEMLLMVDD